jgi:hypothetical protein
MASSAQNKTGAGSEKPPASGPPPAGLPPSGTDADNSIATLALNFRYVAAWNEVSTRIGLRQNALTIYVTLSTGILTILATAPKGGFPIDVNTFSMLMPVVSTFLGLLNLKHDKTIALLRKFMRECESNGVAERLKLPGYNLDDRYRKKAERFRKFHDYSAALLIFLFNGIGLYIAYYSVPTVSDLTRWPIAIYVGFTFFSIYLVMHSTFRPDADPKTS